jgi:hypothetical protein
VVKHVSQPVVNCSQVLTATGSFVEQSARLPGEPFISTELRFDKFAHGKTIEINRCLWSWYPESDLEDPPRCAMHSIGLVAFADIGPIGQKHSAVRAADQIDSSKPRVRREEKIGLMLAHIGRSAALDPVTIEPPAVQIHGEGLATVLLGPLVSQIEE